MIELPDNMRTMGKSIDGDFDFSQEYRALFQRGLPPRELENSSDRLIRRAAAAGRREKRGLPRRPAVAIQSFSNPSFSEGTPNNTLFMK